MTFVDWLCGLTVISRLQAIDCFAPKDLANGRFRADYYSLGRFYN